jgi:hypothetical protein
LPYLVAQLRGGFIILGPDGQFQLAAKISQFHFVFLLLADVRGCFAAVLRMAGVAAFNQRQ